MEQNVFWKWILVKIFKNFNKKLWFLGEGWGLIVILCYATLERNFNKSLKLKKIFEFFQFERDPSGIGGPTFCVLITKPLTTRGPPGSHHPLQTSSIRATPLLRARSTSALTTNAPGSRPHPSWPYTVLQNGWIGSALRTSWIRG